MYQVLSNLSTKQQLNFVKEIVMETYSGGWEGSISEGMVNLNTDDELQDVLFNQLLPCFSCIHSQGCGHNEDCRAHTGCTYKYVGGGYLTPSEHDDGRE